MANKRITPRAEDYSQWYLDIVREADLAENSPVRGCIIFKPNGYALWEKYKEVLDVMFKETGHRNAYFPLFIPKSYFEREATHVDGFAKESAVVTHYRIKNDGQGNLIPDPDAKLSEELIVRPTSETIIHESFSRWVKSYRDLPILINQWANIVRWEMRTKPFLRTVEFLWQEGHTAHATHEESHEEVIKMLGVYRKFSEEFLAIPVIEGEKSPNERFAGADHTYSIEAMMSDGKALQAGTSHDLGQNFSKVFDVKYVNKENKEEYCWLTSWGLSTRMIGALIMVHSDDNGLVLPPKIAETQVVIVPVKNNENLMKVAEDIWKALSKKGISVELDYRDHHSFGYRMSDWEVKGIPVRVEIGERELEKGEVSLFRRDLMKRSNVSVDKIEESVEKLLEDIQTNLFESAKKRMEENTVSVDTYDEFKEAIKDSKFVMAHWDETAETEESIKQETKATIRNIPFDSSVEGGKCVYSGKPSSKRVLFAKSY